VTPNQRQISEREVEMTAKRTTIATVVLSAFFFPALALDAQEPPQDAPPKSADPKQKPAKPNTDNATNNAPDQPKWDPLRAEKDLDVGQYYMKRGDYDAAIDRFNDAIEAKPGYAIPFRWLGEAEEKKGVKKKAVKAYQRYLDLVPHADDAEKIRKKIEKLRREIDKESK
jgi:tetratricopeptide (TPR) repeat protein